MEMTLEEKMWAMKTLYKRMKGCSSTAGRKYNYTKMVDIFNSEEKIQHMWIHDPSIETICDRFEMRFNCEVDKKTKKAIEHIIKTHMTYGGVYLMVQTEFDPITEEKKYYTKVGQSTDIEQRIKSYITHNPCYKLIDTWELENSVLDCAEKHCHEILAANCVKHIEHSEWYEINRETFFEIVSNKFGYFGFKA